MPSSSDPSQYDSQDNAAVAYVNRKELNSDAQSRKVYEDLFTHIEAGFVVIMKDLMKKCGEPLTDFLKILLECSICKGLITSAVSGHCLHTFCSDCITHWISTSSSGNCPICRDDIVVQMKIPVIDEAVKMLVDLSYTGKENEKRSNEIHQPSSARNAVFIAGTLKTKQGEKMDHKHPDFRMFSGVICGLVTKSLLSDVWDKFKLDINEGENISDILLRIHIKMFFRDLESISLKCESIS